MGVMEEMSEKYSLQSIPSDFLVKAINRERKFSQEVEKRAEEIWQVESQKRPLFNGHILHMTTLKNQYLEGEFIPYKIYLAQMIDSALAKKFNFTPVGVSGVIRSGEQLLIAKRSKEVTLFSGCYELAPSGGLSEVCYNGEEIDYCKELLLEMKEETGIDARKVVKVEPFALVHFTPPNPLIDICIYLTLPSGEWKQKCLPTPEYSSLEWIPLQEIAQQIDKSREKWVPTSLLMIERILGQ